ncbi:MAG: amidohydrolase [Desulfobacteraceae bacterium]|nr:amidohydrolase [Desulfobacteraceae bacterium]
MIIDNHCHLEEENSAEKMIQAMNAGGIDKSVLFAPACENLPSVPKALLWFARTLLQSPLFGVAIAICEDVVSSVPGKIKASGTYYDIFQYPDNRPVAEAIKKEPDRFIGFVFLNPKDNPNVKEQFEEAVHRDKMQGVKVHAWFHNYDPSELLQDIGAGCQELGLPILIHLGSRPDTSNIQGLIDNFPKLNLILAHLGIPWFRRSWDMAKQYSNIYLDISGPYLSAKLVRKAVRFVGPGKLIFGTDAPYGIRTAEKGKLSYASSKAWVEKLPLSQEDKEKIFSGNLLKLLKPV